MSIRTYSELIQFDTFEERFRYLKLNGVIGEETFGFDRWLNQTFYRNDPEWKRLKREVIIRDNGCDLGVPGFETYEQRIIIHHMNPVTKDDIIHRTKFLLDPEYLISTTLATHNAIHYGDDSILMSKEPVVRTRFDTCPWKR